MREPIFLASSAAPARVGGVDVTHLLRDIGEASASSNPTDLFGLCLSAQRVLEQVQAGSASTLAHEEAALLAAYRAMRGADRGIVLDFSRAMAGQAQPPRTALATVHTLRPGGVR